MAVPTVDTVAPGGVIDLSASPAGALDDAAFDALFSDTPNVVVAPAPAQPAAPIQQSDTSQQPTVTQTQPQTQPPPTPQTSSQPFLKGEKSVYNSADAAIAGINQKDALIEQLRQRYALTTGIDPITGQPVGQPVVQQGPTDYYSDPNKYLNDLIAAGKEADPAQAAAKYRDVQAQFVRDTLKPLQPIVSQYTRQTALQNLQSQSPELKDVGTFIGTPTYQKALDLNPDLKQAIAISESDFRFSDRLPGLYKLAYLAGQGMQMPDLIKAAQQQPAPQIPSQQPIRTTAQPTTPSMPQQTARPSMRDINGIRATIQEMEARGHKLEF